jgi:hypothetical protein
VWCKPPVTNTAAGLASCSVSKPCALELSIESGNSGFFMKCMRDMTREQKEQRVQKQDGKAFENYNIKIRRSYLNPKYHLKRQTANVITPTGLLKVFELTSLTTGPSFTGRYYRDSKQTAPELKIDIDRVSPGEKQRFKRGRGGYAGHHAEKVLNSPDRKYRVCIRTPNELIFKGTILFNLHFKMEIEEKLTFKDEAVAVVEHYAVAH